MNNNINQNIVKRVAICQARPVSNDVRANVETIIRWMEKAKVECQADLAVFGELFLTNYDLEHVASLSEHQNGPSARAIQEEDSEPETGETEYDSAD